MPYQKYALHSLGWVRYQRRRILKAALFSALLFAPAAALTMGGLGAGVFVFALAANYSALCMMLARRLQPASWLAIPACYLIGRLCVDWPLPMFAVLAASLALLACSARHGLHKGVQFWVFALLLGDMTPAAAIPPWQEAGWMLLGAAYGGTLARIGLKDWFRVLPAASAADVRRYAWHLLPWGLLAWLAGGWMHSAHAWWLPIAAIAIPDPSPERMLWLARERAMGTLAGALLSGLLYWLLRALSLGPLWHVLALAALQMTMLIAMRHSFRVFVALLTALVLSLLPTAQLASGALERVEDTLIAALLFGALAWFLRQRAQPSPNSSD
ncbi:FUSC family protein [Chromobacterium sp. IIBBL 290-4]|uniref:FUSC family protein n=1 Tax=Chromobacterium sp. IIBBL 290-4 TaxID=2953890 RepID=UPI0020B760F3|nr:FUSC family protein [Chromobacterium sp. IIBBL 290-4]UTH76065.1 FUSC family protein [Chromobacterium sp. IIBBL 290-4]